jgi:hypothetical protein
MLPSAESAVVIQQCIFTIDGCIFCHVVRRSWLPIQGCGVRIVGSAVDCDSGAEECDLDGRAWGGCRAGKHKHQ